MHGTLEEYNAAFCFDKVLTSSDAGGHGRVVIPKVIQPLVASPSVWFCLREVCQLLLLQPVTDC